MNVTAGVNLQAQPLCQFVASSYSIYSDDYRFPEKYAVLQFLNQPPMPQFVQFAHLQFQDVLSIWGLF